MNPPPSATPGTVQILRFSGPMGWLLRLLLALASVVFMISALLVGAVLGTVFIIWALVRGRRPAPGLFEAQVHRARRRAAFRPEQTIDIEVREVHDARDEPTPRG